MSIARHLRLGVLLAVGVAIVAGGVAYASIPDGTGVYSACMLKSTGTIRMIDPSLPGRSLRSHCTRLETEITWNQTGPAASVIAGSFDASNCTQETASSAYTVTLVTTGPAAPYCKVALNGLGGPFPVVPATSFGASFPAVVTTQGASGLDFQVWDLAGTNETGQPGAGYVDFVASAPTP